MWVWLFLSSFPKEAKEFLFERPKSNQKVVGGIQV
jgi:hypothetical protein